MGIKFIPRYSCDGCGLDFEDANKVRIFESRILNGDQTKQYIESGMFCIECIPLALDFENKNPETVKIVDPIKALADKEEQFEKDYQKIVDKLSKEIKQNEHTHPEFTKTMEDIKNIKAWINVLKNQNKSSDPIFQISMYDQKNKHLDNSNYPAKSLLPEIELTEDTNSLIHGDELTDKYVEHITSPKEEQETSQEPETTNEIINSETEEDEIDQFGEESGNYLILRLIDSELTEMKFAQKNNYKDLKDLRATCGNKPLIGLYYSINRFTDDPDIDGDYNMNYKPAVKIINKMFFGIPSIVERNVFMYENLGIALIEKELFDDKIEAIKYEIPHEEVPEEKPHPTINNMLKKFVDDTIDKSRPKKYDNDEKQIKDLQKKVIESDNPIITSTQETKPKKKFSSNSIGDDYI